MAHPSSSSEDSSRIPLYAAIAVLGTIGGVAAIGYYAVAGWMRPPTPMVLAVTAVLLPLLALNIVLALVSSPPRETVVSAIRPALFVTLGVGLLGIGAGAAWMSPQVRQHGLAQAADRGLRAGVIEALEDPAEPIVADACQRLFALGIQGYRQPLLDLLDRRPVIARECLRRVGDSARASEIGQVVTERWHAQLLSSTTVLGQRQCLLARELPRMPRASEAGIPALLSCAFQAPTETARSCCTESLEQQVGTGDQLADALGDTVVRTIAEQLGAPLVQASLHQLQMEDADESRAERLGLTTPAIQRYVAGFACAYTLNSRQTNEVTEQLAAWLDDRSCRADISRVEQNINGWHRVCRHLAVRLASEIEPPDLICDAVELEAIAATRKKATGRVEGAIAGARDQFMEAKILAGIAMKERRLHGALSFLNDLDRDELRSGSTLADLMSRMRDPEFRHRIDKLVVADKGLVKSDVDGDPQSLDDLNISEEVKEKFERNARNVDPGRSRLRELEDRIGGFDTN